MHNCHVKMKDGRQFCAPTWSVRYEEGWFTLVGDPETKIYFKDVESAVIPTTRDTINKLGVDLLEKWDRFKKEGF